MVQKGILMEIGKRHWVVMTADGEFLEIPHRGREARLGEEVHFTFQENPGWFGMWMRNPWITGGLAAAVLVIAMLLPLFQPMDVNAQSYIYLDDTESSLVIGVNKDKEVISVDGANNKGKELADQIKGKMAFKGTHVDEFVATLLAQAKTEFKGLLNAENGVIVSQAPSNAKAFAEKGDAEGTLNKIRNKVNQDPELKGTQLVYTLSLPDELKQRAKGYHLSPGKYALWLLAREEGENVKIEELHDRSVANLVALLDVSLEKEPLTKKEWLDIMNRQDPEHQPVLDEPLDGNSGKAHQQPKEGSGHGTKGNNKDGNGTEPGADRPEAPEPDPEEGSSSGGGSGSGSQEPGTGEDSGASSMGGNSTSDSSNQ